MMIFVDFDLIFMMILMIPVFFGEFTAFPACYAYFRPASLSLPGWNAKGLEFQTSWNLSGQGILSGLARFGPGGNAWATPV
ncbi:hypothetical protein LIER_36201 [Lithospermum erythrorhizon]|uniref:Uncharacterized protein n=1 Tax=Lithospermum erythrorhizon TaxID=34254 RepID=A0AAV3P6F6_LITER